MSAMEAAPSIIPFESVSELREAHADLLEALEKQLRQDASVGNEAAALAQVKTQIRQFIERGTATGVYIEEIKERTDCQILLDYWVSSLSQVGQQISTTRLASFDGQKLPDLTDKPCPYAGLEAFRDRTFFFGRESATQKLLDQLRDAPLVVVLGASGSGKSSLVMGGVLPALRESGATPELRIVPPFVPGNAVLKHLADAILRVCVSLSGDVEGEAEKLRQDPQHLYAIVGGPDAPPTLITIDQFEEVFTLSEPADREALAANLAHILDAEQGHRVILTMREEFKSHMVELRALNSYIDKAWYSIMPMGYEELKAAVERPASLVNLQFQAGIVDELVKKVLGQSAALPLLQFTLRSLWEKRDRNRITWEVYRKVGDPLNALKTTADRFFDGLAPQTQDEVRRILLELVRVDELLEAYRQPVPKNQLLLAKKANTEEVLKLLAENDYVRITTGGTDTDVLVEVKHESLVRNWPRFVAWIDEKRHQRRQRLVLAQAAQRWKESGRPPEGLLTGWQAQAAKDQADLSELEKEYVQASIAAADHMQQEKEAALVRQAKLAGERRILRYATLVFFVGAVLSVSLWIDAKKARDRSEGYISFLLSESFLGELRDTGRSTLLDQVDEQMGKKQRTDLNRGLALRNSGDIARMQGRLKESVDFFSKALTAIDNSPDDPARWREAARTGERLGEALADQGQVTQALTHYEAAVNAWRHVVGDSLVKTDDCTSLADSLISLGDLKNRMGNANLAINDLDEAVNITADVLIGHQASRDGCGPAAGKAEPYLNAKALEVFSNAIMLRVSIFNYREDYYGLYATAMEATKLRPHSVSAMKNALVARAYRGNSQIFDQPQSALKDYRQALAGFEVLRQRDPDNRLWQRERAANQLLLAEGMVACQPRKCDSMPSLAEAEATVLEATAALRALNQIDPSNVSLQSDLGWALKVHAKVLAAKGRKDESLQKIEEAESAYLKAQIDKADASGVVAYGSVLVEKADALASLARWPEAKEAVQKSITIFNGLIAGNQGNLAFMWHLHEARQREVQIRRKAGDLAGADAANRDASKLRNSIQSVSRGSKEDYAEFLTHVNDGATLFKRGDYAAALSEFHAAEPGARKYIRHHPAVFSGYRELSNIYSWLRLTQEKLGNEEGTAALGTWLQAAQIAVLLAPEASKAKMNENLLNARYYFDIFLYKNRRLEETLAMVQEEIVVAEGLVQLAPQNASYLQRLGNAKCGLGTARRDLKMAGWEEAIRSGLIHIQKAADAAPKEVAYLNELGDWRKYLAEQYEADGQNEYASREYPRALRVYRKAARDFPGNKEADDAIHEIDIALDRLGVR